MTNAAPVSPRTLAAGRASYLSGTLVVVCFGTACKGEVVGAY